MPGAPSSSLGGGFPLGLAGAIAATRYVGATASGAPAAGTFAVGDFIIDQTGKVYVCTVAGSPGTWTQAGGAAATSELAYAQVTTDVTITSTTEASPDAIVSLGAVVYAAVPTILEFYCPLVDTGPTVVVAVLRDVTTELCRLCDLRPNGNGNPMYGKIRLTPTAASHTYNVAGFRATANATMHAGTGAGGSGTYAPIFMRALLA